MSHVARRVHVTGLVQGVFFRAWTAEHARQLGVTGWVRNADDGSVEAHVEGPPDAVAALVDWAHEGPRRAHVDRVEVHDAAPERGDEFRVRD